MDGWTDGWWKRCRNIHRADEPTLCVLCVRACARQPNIIEYIKLPQDGGDERKLRNVEPQGQTEPNYICKRHDVLGELQKGNNGRLTGAGKQGPMRCVKQRDQSTDVNYHAAEKCVKCGTYVYIQSVGTVGVPWSSLSPLPRVAANNRTCMRSRLWRTGL